MFATTLVKQFGFILLVTCAAFAAHDFFPYGQSNWVIWSIFLFIQLTLGRTPIQRIGYLMMVGVLVIVTVFLAGAIYPDWLKVPFVFILVLSCSYLGYLRPAFAYTLFVVVVLSLLAAWQPVSWLENIDRARWLACGVFVVVLCYLLYLPYFYRDEKRALSLATVRNLRLVCTEIFACLQDESYADNVYLFERRLHMRKIRLLDSLTKLRDVAGDVSGLENIYQLLLDVSQIRRRVSDHTTFALCKQEMASIEECLNVSFVNLAIKVARSIDYRSEKRVFRVYPESMFGAVRCQWVKGILDKLYGRVDSAVKPRNDAFRGDSQDNEPIELDTNKLLVAIRRFEENFHHVLQVTSRDPLVFVFFIASLHALKDEFAW